MAPCISIGNQGFESIREENSFYIDKSDFIREWWESADVMTLITRPSVWENPQYEYGKLFFFKPVCGKIRSV